MTINRLNQGVTNQVLVKAVSGQTTPLLELQDSSGAVVSSIGPTGVLGGTLGDSGLVHIDTISSGSGVSAATLDNIFTSTYDDYYIDFRINPSTSANHDLRLVASGTARSTNYGSVCIGFGGNTSVLGRVDQSTLIPCTPTDAQTTNTVKIGVWINFSDTGNYRGFSQTSFVRGGGAEGVAYSAWRNFGGSGITGIQCFPSTGTISATIRAYGFKK